MTPPPPGYPSAQPGPTFDEAPSTPPSGNSMDNNNKDGPLARSMAPPPGRSAAPSPVGSVRLQGKKDLLTVAFGIMIFVYAMTAATAIGTSNRMHDYGCKENDCNTIPVSYFGAWYKLDSSRRHKRDYGRREPDYEPGVPDYEPREPQYFTSGPDYEPREPQYFTSGPYHAKEPETVWRYEPTAATLVHFWLFALSDFPSALVAIFVLANIALFCRALFYFIAMIVLVICFLVYLVAPIVITATTLSGITPTSVALGGASFTVKEALAYDCPGDSNGCETVKRYQSWQITAIVLMWLFGLVSALLRAGYPSCCSWPGRSRRTTTAAPSIRPISAMLTQ